MTKKILATCGICLLASLTYAFAADKADSKAGSLLSHSVYFSLNESTPESRQKLTESCKKYLSQHPGVVFFSAGPLSDEAKGQFNDRDFDVVLLMVFSDHAALHQYAASAGHQKFIAENAASFKNVRIFDADVERVAVPDDVKGTK